MKKLLSIALALITAASMSVTAFAATELGTSPETGKAEGDYSIGVSGKYEAGSTTADPKISVDIAWENMEFTYTAGKTEYSPTTHKTTTIPGAWSTDKKYIEMKNHSNSGIIADFGFTKSSDVNITGSFYDKADATTALTSDKQSLALASGEDKTTEEQTYTTPSGKIYFGISGDAISENKTLGTITVTVRRATVVTSQAELGAALAAIKTTGGVVNLGNDISIGGDGIMSIVGGVDTSPITLDLRGHTLTGMLWAGADVETENEEKTNYIIQNGTLANSQPSSEESENFSYENCVIFSCGHVKLNNVTVNATNLYAIRTWVAINDGLQGFEIVDSELNGGITIEGTDYIGQNLGGTFRLSGNVTASSGKFMITFDSASIILMENGTYNLYGETINTTVYKSYRIGDAASTGWLVQGS